MAAPGPCPATPKSDKPKDLGFKRQSMVDWLAPGQLVNTGIKALLSGVFGAYADKREVMAALHPEPELKKEQEDYGDQAEIWIDYIADLGDGFDATYTMARLLAQEILPLDDGGAAVPTRRGRLLVLGGDQVYPTASFEEYRNRMIKPYTAALPCVMTGEEPRLFAVPGNHDWYDGLSNFTRIFCQRRKIGGWKTVQRRSYFALRLPHGWWLWGIDIQLEGYIDQPQIDFFRHYATHHMQPGDRVILCTAEPSWVFTATGKPEAFRSLGFLEDKTIRGEARSEPRVVLTGDLHHYVRYASAEGVQRITAGGGGAYLYATHEMPKEIELEEGFQETARKILYKKETAFPDEKTSSKLAWGALLLPWKSRKFGFFLAVLYSLYAWIVQSASKARSSEIPHGSLMDHLQSLAPSWQSFGDVLWIFGKVLAHSPASVIFTALILSALYAFCPVKRKPVKAAIGITHGLAHVLLNILLLWAFTRINQRLLGPGIDTWQQVLAFVIEMALIGGLLGGALMAAYFLLCSKLGGFHTNEVFSSQRIADYKNFLRLHIDATGKLTIYSVGVREVVKKWRFNAEARNGQPWFEPDGGQKLEAELIEKIQVP